MYLQYGETYIRYANKVFIDDDLRGKYVRSLSVEDLYDCIL